MAVPGRGAAAPAGFLRPPLAATQVLPGAVRTSYVNPPPEQRKRTGLWVLVSLLLLASIGYCAYRLWPAVEDLMQRTRENRTVSAKQKRVAPSSSAAADPPPATLASSEPAETNAAVDSDASTERPAPFKAGAPAV